MMYYLQVTTVIFLLFGISLVHGFIDQCAHYEMLALPYDPTQWIVLPVDHFNDSDPRTWRLKYYKIMKYWKPEGPLLLYLQGTYYLPPPVFEDDQGNVGYKPQTFVNNIAKETGAAYFMLEHRYYGDSMPFEDIDTTESLAFLTTRQALEDVIHLLKTLKKTPEFKSSKVILVGGFYAGNLAVWLKQLYPELIDAVLASSAPLLAKVDFSEYLETVTDTFRTYGSQECVNKIDEKFNTIYEMLQTPEGIEEVKQKFQICQGDDMTIPENQQLFFSLQTSVFSEYAQYRIPADTTEICQGINSSKLENPLLFTKNRDGIKCYTYDFNLWVSLVVLIPVYRLWMYQICNEFGYLVTTSSNEQMFGKFIPPDLNYKICKKFFGEEFNEDRMERGVINTNSIYGGLTPNVTNVVFVNGDMDPWHRLSIVHDLSADVPAIFINGSAHCHDFYPHLNDSDSVKEARKEILKLLKKWIGQA